MSGQQLAQTRKRQRTEQHPVDSKRQKLNPHSSSPGFWDDLSKIWLTEYALRELDRRNAKLFSPSPSRRIYRPVTRNFVAEVKKLRKPAQPAGDFLHHCAPKTLKDIKLFARHGGPDLTDLRAYTEPVHSLERAMSSSHSSRDSRDRKRGSASSSRTKTTSTNTTVTKDTKNSRPKDANYQQKLIDSGIYPYGYKYPDGLRPPLPSEWEELNRRLVQPRPSLSPSRFPDEDYQEFIQADAEAHNEDAVKDSVLPAMLRAMGASRGAQKNILFTNLDPVAAGISQAKPDYYYGAQPEQIHQKVRTDLSNLIIPSSHTHLPAVPNFSLEAKGPDGSLAEAMRQTCHNGAIGERAMRNLHTYKQDEPVYDNRVHTISSIYHGGQLKLYGHSAAQPNGQGMRPEYYMHQLGAYAMTGTPRNFRDGATAFKNARDLTAEYRNGAIAYANEIAAQTIQGEEEDEDDEEDEGEDTNDEGIHGESLSITCSFAQGVTNSTLSTLTEDDDDQDESETSLEEESRRPPAKRSSSKSHPSHHRQKRKSRTSSSPPSSGQQKRGSWFGW